MDLVFHLRDEKARFSLLSKLYISILNMDGPIIGMSASLITAKGDYSNIIDVVFFVYLFLVLFRKILIITFKDPIDKI